MMSSSLPLLFSEGANSNLDLAAFRLDEVVGLLNENEQIDWLENKFNCVLLKVFLV